MMYSKQMMSLKTLSLAVVAAVLACLAIHGGQTCEARGLDGQQEGFLQAISQNQNIPTPLELQQQQQQQQASLDLDDDDDDDDRADQQPQPLVQAGSALYQQPIVMADRSGDLNPAASKHYHHGHGAKGWLDMGAWTGKKGAFGWYDKHPVGKGK